MRGHKHGERPGTGRIGAGWLCGRCEAQGGLLGAQGGPWAELAHLLLGLRHEQVEGSTPLSLGGRAEPAAQQRLQAAPRWGWSDRRAMRGHSGCAPRPEGLARHGQPKGAETWLVGLAMRDSGRI